MRAVLDLLLLRRTTSRLTFSLVLASYAFGVPATAFALLTAIGVAGPRSPCPPPGLRGLELVTALLVAPIGESFALAAIIGRVSRVTSNLAAGVGIPTAILCGLHALVRPELGLAVAPLYLACSYAYVRWRPFGFWGAILPTMLIHFLHNAAVAVVNFVLQ